MAHHRARLAPERMTNAALYQRARTLVNACRFTSGATAHERERYLEELDAVLLELQMRGTQLALV